MTKKYTYGHALSESQLRDLTISHISQAVKNGVVLVGQDMVDYDSFTKGFWLLGNYNDND